MDPQNAAFPIPVVAPGERVHVPGDPHARLPVLRRRCGARVCRGGTGDHGRPALRSPWPGRRRSRSSAEEHGRGHGDGVTAQLGRQLAIDGRPTSCADRFVRERSGLSPEGAQSAAVLGVLIEGSFNSLFADRPNPLLVKERVTMRLTARTRIAADGAADAADEGRPVSSPVSSTDRPNRHDSSCSASKRLLSGPDPRRHGSAGRQRFYGNSLQLLANAIELVLRRPRAPRHPFAAATSNRTLPAARRGGAGRARVRQLRSRAARRARSVFRVPNGGEGAHEPLPRLADEGSGLTWNAHTPAPVFC